MPTQVGPVKVIDSIQLSGECIVTGIILELRGVFLQIHCILQLNNIALNELIHHTDAWLWFITV